MDNLEWMIKIERELQEIKSLASMIKEQMPVCEKEKQNSQIRSIKWLLGILISTFISLIGVLFYSGQGQ